MKLNNNQLVGLLIMTITFEAQPIIESFKQPQQTIAAKGKVIDAPDVMHLQQSYQELLQSHQPAPKKSTFLIPSIHDKNKNGLEPLHDAATFKSNETIDVTTRTGASTATTVTPSALLLSVLKDSQDYADAYTKLDDLITSSKTSDAQKKVAQQAQTLLTRAQPSIIFTPDARDLKKIPPIFITLVRNTISYVKQQLPRLTTYESQLRFTQSVMMEALKTMDKTFDTTFLNSIQFDSAGFNGKLNEISNKYANSLGVNNNQSNAFIAQWSRNIIAELALLLPRTIGATIGAGAGIAAGIPIGVLAGSIEGARYGGEIGSQSGKKPLSTIGTTLTGAAVGAGIGATVRGVHIGTVGAVGGGALGAQGGEYLARSAANTAGKKIDSAAQSVNRSAKKTYRQIKESLPQLTRTAPGEPNSSQVIDLQKFKNYNQDVDTDASSTNSDEFFDTQEEAL